MAIPAASAAGTHQSLPPVRRRAHHNRPAIAAATGDHDRARELSAQTLELYRALDDRQSEAQSLIDLGRLALTSGDLGAARTQCDQAREIANVLGNRQLEGLEARLRGAIVAREGDLEEAEVLFRRALELAREVGHDSQAVTVAIDLSGLLIDRGDVAGASELAAGLRSFADGSYPPAMLVLARLQAAEGRPAEALALAEAAREASGRLWSAADQAVLDGLRSLPDR